MAFRSSSTVDTATLPVSNKPILHHVDPVAMSTHRRSDASEHSRHPSSPPPKGPLDNSPALSVSSLDRSSGASPPPRRSSTQHSMPPAPAYSNVYASDAHVRPHSRPQHNSHISGRLNMNTTQGYSSGYNGHASFDHRYDMNSHSDHPSYQMHSTIPGTHANASTIPQNRAGYGSPYSLPSQANNNHIVHTDDATTKLSERVRRRCFNCCTTDTSTWRRSNLSPGKVLCNKCGLFERTHSRPRPEQFPHKRGPLATSALRPRATPSPPLHSQTLPPISTHGPLGPPPHMYSHPSIAPLASIPDSRRSHSSSNTLPEIQSWADAPGNRSVPLQMGRKDTAPDSPVREVTPPPYLPSSSSAAPTHDSRHVPNTRESGTD